MNNPLIYGAGKMGVECTCQQWDVQHRFAISSFWFNGSEMHDAQPLIGMINYDTDFNISFTNITT